MYGLGTPKRKSLSRNLSHLSRDQCSELRVLHVSFPADFCTCMQNALCFQSPERNRRLQGTLSRFVPPQCPRPSPPSGGGRGRAGCAVRRTHLEVPLDASTACLCQAEPAPQPSPVCCRVSARASSLRVSGAAPGRGYGQPQGQPGNYCQGKGSKSLLPALLQNICRLCVLGLRIIPRSDNYCLGTELGEKRTAEEECLGNTGLKALLSFCNIQIAARGFI